MTALGVNGKPFMAYNASRYVGQLMSVDSFPRRSFIEDHYCFLPYSSYAPLYALRYIECTLNAMRVAFVTSFGCGYISGIRVLDRLYSGQGLARESLIQYSVPTSSAISWSFVDMPKQKCEGLDWGLPRLADLMVPRVSVQELPEQLAKGRFQVKKVNVALPIWSVSKGLNVEGSRPERAVGPLSDRIKQRWLEDLEDEKDEYSPSCKKKHKRKMKERKREDKELCADTLPVDVELISSPHQIDAAMDRLIRECSMDKCRFPASMDGVVDVHGLEFDIGHPVVGFDTETTALGLNRHILVKKEKEIAVLLKRKKVLGSLMREEKKKENQRLSNKQIEKWKNPKVASLKTAVVQISTYKTVHIFHISKLGHFPQQLADFILDSRIIKVCQGIRDDLESLVHDFPDVFSEAYERLSSRPKLPSHPKKPMGHQGYSFGLLDLQRLSNAADIFPFGLQAMSAGLLGFYMDKTYQTANWDSEVLHPDLIDYAATDAWASREAYFAMYRMSNRANETLDFLQRKHVVRRAELQRRTFLPDGTPVDSRWHPYPNSASAFAFNFERFTSTFKDPPRYLKENNGPMKTILILAATIAQRYRESNVL